MHDKQVGGLNCVHYSQNFFIYEFCCSIQDYNNAYGGQQVSLRWYPAYCQPFYGLGRQIIPTTYVKKVIPDMPSQELTVVGFSEPTSASASIPSTGCVSKLKQCHNFLF